MKIAFGLWFDFIFYFVLNFLLIISKLFFLINYSLSRRILKYYAYNFDGMLYLLDLISIKMHTALMIPKSFIDFEFDCSQYVLYTAGFYFLCQIKYFISSLYFCLVFFFGIGRMIFVRLFEKTFFWHRRWWRASDYDNI